MDFLNSTTVVIVINFFILIFAMISVILSLGIVWQAEKRLDKAFKVFTLAIAIFTFVQLFRILELIDVVDIGAIKDLFILFFVFILMLALGLVNKLLREVWKDK